LFLAKFGWTFVAYPEFTGVTVIPNGRWGGVVGGKRGKDEWAKVEPNMPVRGGNSNRIA